MLIRRGIAILALILSYALMSSNVWVLDPPETLASSDTISPLAQSDLFQTEQGPVRGELVGNSIVFRGIPYAAPPTGELRWRPPQSAPARTDVLDAVRFGPICPQFASNFPSPPSTTPSGSEDCLTLNIWAPKTKETSLRPVMFFIHGGGNVNGAGSQGLYDGQTLSEKGKVITVTINYRLGPFGFLGHPLLSAEDPNNSSGNYGLLDQIIALQWVQKNISNFGGDPNNVTIFGESAGGLNVSSLIASPLAAGLFDKAIVESAGQIAGPFILNKPLRGTGGLIESAENFGQRLTRALGCESSPNPLACLRSKTPAELLTIIVPDETATDGSSYGPNIDGYVLPGSILSVLKSGAQNNVPLIIGTNKNEGSTFITGMRLNSEADYRAALQANFGDFSDEIFARYPPSSFGGSPKVALEALITDLIFLCPARAESQLVAARQPNTYVYQFTQGLKILPDLGAFHGFELPFVFGNLSIIPGASGKDKKLSKIMLGYWTNFAKKGDPNGAGLPKWPAYTVSNDTNIVLNPKVKTDKALRKDFCDFLADLFEFD